MKKLIFTGLLAIVFAGISLNIFPVSKVSVEILYMNHGPLQSTLNKIKFICSKYGDKIIVSWYDFETPDGEKFMKEKGITRHIPLMIWISKKPSYRINGKDMLFSGFPGGSGPASFQGKWTVDDFEKALEMGTRKK